ncbi:tyrosine protein kinase [Paenibacillus sp. URB8-2]|uniref:tyrosine protein kinase n=1 Tax=Paenibacillus sp. URB8-2 TaxID=2741301 RepID=UPI0015BCC342|nr:tyrosine protein kinase [Paenibacillus sp. URB8-2]BCG57316.1 hypothetical protein PUR_07410 [Paenibacillus sp. URB8-2]
MPHHYYNHSHRSSRALTEPYNASPYPGISNYVQVPGPGTTGAFSPLGAEAAETALAVPAAAETAAKGGGLLGNLGGLANLANMDQIKGLIDRMGGIDGIVSSMGKVQKVMQGFQQMAPMFKLVMGSIGKGKGKGGAGLLAAEEDSASYAPSRRKKRTAPKRRKSGSSGRRRSGSSSGKRRRK